jgi:hypothetical protein
LQRKKFSIYVDDSLLRATFLAAAVVWLVPHHVSQFALLAVSLVTFIDSTAAADYAATMRHRSEDISK